MAFNSISRFRSTRSFLAVIVMTAFGGLSFANAALAADERPLDKPAASQFHLLAGEQIASRRIQDLNLDQIAIDDELIRLNDQAPRYAIPHEVHLTPDTDGTWEEFIDDGGVVRSVWRLSLTCENAVSMNLGFSDFWLPRGGTLFVYSPDMSSIVRPFTETDNADHHQLWTPPVAGNTIVIELSVPKDSTRDVRLTVGSINAGYRRFMEIAAIVDAKSGSCNVDTVCSQGDLWRNEIPSVAVISTGGSTFCTGSMLNNVRQNQTPYFLTAYHCSVTSSNAASLVCFWNYENSTCRTPGSTASGSAGNGQLTQFNTGATFRAAYSASDFTLVQLSAAPNPAWKVSFAGFDARAVETTSNIAIHHPNTDEKRISFDNNASTTTSYNSSTSPGDGTHLRIGAWELGTTEPGSSGSPVFNQNHQVVGQLHGGSASCTSITNDFYGRLSTSWLGGGTAATQLKAWLDPDNTGTTVVNTLTTAGLSVSPASPVTHLGVAGGPFSNLPYAYTVSNSSSSVVNYRVNLTNNIGLLINGGTAAVTGSLAATSGTATVTVSAGAALASLAAGVYTEDIVFTDLGTSVARTIRHTIEVGQTGFTVTPATGLSTGGPIGGPFTTTAVYTISSTNPSPVSVTVSGNAAWIVVDGTASQTFTLTGVGASRSVSVGIGSAANTLAGGIYSGLVSIVNNTGGTGGTTRNVALDVGRQAYAATDVPLTINDNSTAYSFITVADDFCIADVDVAVNATHTYIGDLLIELTAPSGTIVVLHNNSGGNADNIVATYDDDGAGTVPASALSALDNQSAAGVWRLRVSDTATTDTGTLNSWSLRMGMTAGNCPTPEIIYSEPLNTNPGWSLQGQWAFGVPTGGGGNTGYKDPTSGHTGSNVYGYNLAGDYAHSMPAYNLTSTAFDCTGLTGTRVMFWRWLGVESSTYDHAIFSVSDNGTTWTTVWQNAATLRDTAWTSVSYDISAVADNKPTVYFRWTMGTTDSSVAYCGWNIDDLEIWAIAPEVACFGDLDGDQVVGFGDVSVMLLSFGECPGCTEDVDGDGAVTSADLALVLLSFGECP